MARNVGFVVLMLSVLSGVGRSQEPAVGTGPSIKEIGQWLGRDLRQAGSQEASGYRYQIDEISLNACQLTIRQSSRSYIVVGGRRVDAKSRQMDAAIIPLKDINVGLLMLASISAGTASIPTFWLRLAALPDRGEPFTVQSEGYQGGPKSGPANNFGLRLWDRGSGDKAIAMIRRAALLCGAPETPSPTTAAAKPPETSAQQSAPMSNEQVIQLVSAGLSEEVVITSIKQATTKTFDLSTAGLINLKKAGVSDTVIAAMQQSQRIH